MAVPMELASPTFDHTRRRRCLRMRLAIPWQRRILAEDSAVLDNSKNYECKVLEILSGSFDVLCRTLAGGPARCCG
jgi:hypothetical protein